MRIHTNLTREQMLDVIRAAGAPIYFNHIDQRRSATHKYAFEVRLGGSSMSRTNAGNRGAGDETAATWDEWGAFFGALYAADPTARCGGTAKRPVYADADDFHFQTGYRFGPGLQHMPTDTHPRHSWKYEGTWGDHGTGSYSCAYKGGCSATRPAAGQVIARRNAAKIGA